MALLSNPPGPETGLESPFGLSQSDVRTSCSEVRT